MPLVDPRPDEHLREGSEQALQPALSRLLAETPELAGTERAHVAYHAVRTGSSLTYGACRGDVVDVP